MDPSPPPKDNSIADVVDLEVGHVSPSTIFPAESPSEDGASSVSHSSNDLINEEQFNDEPLYKRHEFFLCQSCKKNPTLVGATPKLLPCLHTFCDSCLRTLHEQQKSSLDTKGKPQDDHRIRCPSCWQEFFSPSNAVDSFAINKFITEASTETNRTQNIETVVKKTCTSCEDESPASVYCVDCNDWLCSVCHHAHQRVKVTKDHKIRTEEEFNNDSKDNRKLDGPILCKYHPKETLKLFCTDCDVLTCRDCQLVKHKDHKYQFMDEAATKHKDVLGQLLKLLERNVLSLKDTLIQVDKAGVALKLRENVIEDQVKQYISKLMDYLKERETVLIQDLRQLTKNKLSLLVKQRKDLKQMSMILRHNYNFATFAMLNGSNTALLHTRKILLTRLNNLNSLKYKQPPLAGDNIKLLVDEEKIKEFISRIGFIYTPDEIKRKAEIAASRGGALQRPPSISSDMKQGMIGNEAIQQNSDPGSPAPKLIALSSQGMPYAKIAPTTHSPNPNNPKQNALIILRPGDERQPQSQAFNHQSHSVTAQLLKRKYSDAKARNQVYTTSTTVSRQSPVYRNGEQRQLQLPSQSQYSVEHINVTNVTSLNPAVSRNASDNSKHSTPSPQPTGPSQVVVLNSENGIVVKSERRESPNNNSCQLATNGNRMISPPIQTKASGNLLSGVQESTNDDYCAVCRNGGELLCCDTCPRVFHLTCHIPAVTQLPFDTWSCNLCRKLNATAEPEQSPSKRRTSLSELSEQDVKKCEKILLEIFCHPQSTPFHHKVSKAVPNYHQIITHPMDLTTMRSKLQSCHFQRYESVNDFCEDMNLIFYNCATFNPPHSEVAIMGKTVSTYFQKLAKDHFPGYVHNPEDEPKTKRRRDEYILS